MVRIPRMDIKFVTPRNIILEVFSDSKRRRLDSIDEHHCKHALKDDLKIFAQTMDHSLKTARRVYVRTHDQNSKKMYEMVRGFYNVKFDKKLRIQIAEDYAGEMYQRDYEDENVVTIPPPPLRKWAPPYTIKWERIHSTISRPLFILVYCNLYLFLFTVTFIYSCLP